MSRKRKQNWLPCDDGGIIYLHPSSGKKVMWFSIEDLEQGLALAKENLAKLNCPLEVRAVFLFKGGRTTQDIMNHDDVESYPIKEIPRHLRGKDAGFSVYVSSAGEEAMVDDSDFEYRRHESPEDAEAELQEMLKELTYAEG